jgi:[acyl-carrier-protein] S-malonyltransferase
MLVALLFPGQNSRYPSMIEKLLARDPRNGEWIERASDVLGRDLHTHFRADNAAMFAMNGDVQIGVFLANHLHWQTLERAGIRAAYSAGLSLGEYNHLVHIGALDFDDALRVLERRGEEYDRGPQGTMVAVFPAAVEEIEPVLARLDLGARLGIGIINAPTQCVLSGETAAVQLAAERIADELVAQTVVIDERLPMHSPLFHAVGAALRPSLESVAWRAPSKPYLPNATGRFEFASASNLVDILSRHVWNTVHWRESIDTLVGLGEPLTFIEAGPRSVLTGFLSRKWLPHPKFAVDTVENLNAAMSALFEDPARGRSSPERLQ